MSAIRNDSTVGAAVSPARIFEERVSNAHIPVLDGVRGIAVVLVMVLHFTIMQPLTWGERAFHNFAHSGWAGVDLFFVLSGFLITGILYDARGGERYFRNFYLRRALRIFPLYYAYLAVLFLVLPIVHPSSLTPDGDAKQIWFWTYLGNILFSRVGWEGMPGYTTHLWSLAIEEQFYLVWPLCVYLLSRRRLIQLCIALIAGAAALRIAMTLAGTAPVASYAFTFARVDTLAIGALIAVLVRSDTGRAWLSRYAGRLLGLALVTVALVTASVGVRSGPVTLPALDPVVQLLGYTALAVAFGAALVLTLSASGGSLVYRGLTSTVMRSFGKYSYALYLIHVPLRSVVWHQVDRSGGMLPTVAGSQLPAQLAVIGIGIAVSYGLALLSWNLFEKHFLALKRLFPYEAARDLRKRAPAVTLIPPVVAPDVYPMERLYGDAAERPVRSEG